VVSQSVAFCCLAQSLAFSHCTQSPLLVSQIDMLFGQEPAVHAGWHWLSDQHEGAAVPQSPFDTHCTQPPTRHFGADAGQFALVSHVTQPSVASQSCPFPHVFDPLTPQTALPPPGPPFDPPHASAMMTALAKIPKRLSRVRFIRMILRQRSRVSLGHSTDHPRAHVTWQFQVFRGGTRLANNRPCEDWFSFSCFRVVAAV